MKSPESITDQKWRHQKTPPPQSVSTYISFNSEHSVHRQRPSPRPLVTSLLRASLSVCWLYYGYLSKRSADQIAYNLNCSQPMNFSKMCCVLLKSFLNLPLSHKWFRWKSFVWGMLSQKNAALREGTDLRSENPWSRKVVRFAVVFHLNWASRSVLLRSYQSPLSLRHSTIPT